MNDFEDYDDGRFDGIYYGRFLSNVHRRHAQAVLSAARLTGLDVIVDQYAVNNNGQRIPDMVAVVTHERPGTDMSEFWIAFERLTYGRIKDV